MKSKKSKQKRRKSREDASNKDSSVALVEYSDVSSEELSSPEAGEIDTPPSASQVRAFEPNFSLELSIPPSASEASAFEPNFQLKFSISSLSNRIAPVSTKELHLLRRV